MARRNQSLGLGRRNTAQIRGTTQSVMHGTLTQVYTRVTCVQRRVRCMQTGTYTYTYSEDGYEHMYSGESCTPTFTRRFVHTYVHIKSLPHVFICIHM